MKKAAISWIIYVVFISIANAAYIPLDIINLDKTGENNRARWAYPGIKYEVPVAVEGGLFPFKYELSSAPEGMSISEDGIIIWENPSVSGSPHNVTVKVTDSESTIDTSSISIEVTDSVPRFIFVDKSYVGLENGSISQPYSTLENVWANVSGNEILYFRGGTYTLPHSGSAVDNYRRGSHRVKLGPHHTYPGPRVLLAYPGEVITIDMEKNPTAPVYKGYNLTVYGISDIFIGGLIIDNAWSYAISLQSSASHLTVYDCDFRNIEAEAPFDGNYSYINYMRANHRYNVIHSNNFGGNSSYVMPEGSVNIKFYTTYHSVVTENEFYGLHNAVDLKDSTDYITFRHNRIYNTLLQAMGYTSGNRHTDASFNFFSGGGLSIYLATGRDVTDFWFYRNTLYNSNAYFRYNESGDSTFMNGNVIVYNQVDAGETSDNSYWRNRARYRYSPNVYGVQSVWTGGLYGNVGDAIINSEGQLQEPFRETYLGVAGWETSIGGVPPSILQPPDDFMNDSN